MAASPDDVAAIAASKTRSTALTGLGVERLLAASRARLAASQRLVKVNPIFDKVIQRKQVSKEKDMK